MKIVTISADELREIIREEIKNAGNLVKDSITALEYLNVTQLSKYIHLSVPAIYQRVAEDSIPHNRIGSRIIFERSDIDKWIKSKIHLLLREV